LARDNIASIHPRTTSALASPTRSARTTAKRSGTDEFAKTKPRLNQDRLAARARSDARCRQRHGGLVGARGLLQKAAIWLAHPPPLPGDGEVGCPQNALVRGEPVWTTASSTEVLPSVDQEVVEVRFCIEILHDDRCCVRRVDLNRAHLVVAVARRIVWALHTCAF